MTMPDRHFRPTQGFTVPDDDTAEALRQLDGDINRLIIAIGALTARLSPVLGPDETKDDDGTEKADLAMDRYSPLAVTLSEFQNRIADATRDLNRLAQRVEV